MFLYNEIKKEKKILKNILCNSLKYLKENNILGSILIYKMFSLDVSVRKKEISNIEYFTDISCSITIFNNFKKIKMSFCNVNFTKIKEYINKAIFVSQFICKDPYVGLPKEDLLFIGEKKVNSFFPWIFSIEKSKKIVFDLDESVLNFDKRVSNTEGSSLNSSLYFKILGNSYGWMNSYISTFHSLSSCAIAKEDNIMEKYYTTFFFLDFSDLKNPISLGQKSAQKSIDKLYSKKISTQKSSVIFLNDISGSIFKPLVLALSGYSVYKKSTFLLNYLGKKIFPKWLDIEENPFLEKGLLSKSFDSEGVSTQYRKIVDKGVLKTWLLDTYSGNILGLNSTGHSGGIHNWIIKSNNPKISYNKLLKLMGTGFLVTELIGDGVNIINGDYSRGACGFWIDNGEIKYPVSEIVISGNLLTMWKNIVYISDDILDMKEILCPSCLISNIQISGN